MKIFSKNKSKLMKGIIFLIFLVFVLVLIRLTLFDDSFGRKGIDEIFNWNLEVRKNYMKNSINLTPFETINRYIKGFTRGTVNKNIVFINLVGNAVAFMPFALFLPLLFQKSKRFICFFAHITLAVLTVEVLQFLTMSGSCDIDDLILNVGGACVLFFVLHIKPIGKLVEKITLLPYLKQREEEL